MNLVWRCTLALLLLLASDHQVQARRKPQPAKTQEYLRLHTTYGDIIVALLSKDAPRTTRLVKRLANAQLYDDATFYRAEPGFVVQGGLRDSSGGTRLNPYGPVPLEAGLREVEVHERRVAPERVEQRQLFRLIQHVRARPLDDRALFERIERQPRTHLPHRAPAG